MILVTGATGFLGSELVKQLIDSGKSVRAIKRNSSAIPDI
ncbi:MAG: NAD-dependent epimerase/dehydratase family protein, partial [Mucilaginibacter sp.]